MRTGRPRDDPALAGVVLVAALGLLARLWNLGFRTAHQDEGRVAWLIVEYARSGIWEYRPVVHGPFLFHVNELLFGVVEPTDFSARLVVALVGGLLPLAALLFRSRLDDAEVVALAALLAANPIMLYYSRFMRNDVLVGGFMLAALGFFLRAYDTREPRLLYPGAASFALAFTAKENALVYLATWLGAAALVADHRLLRTFPRDEEWLGVVAATARRVAGARGRWGAPAVLAALEAAVILVFFYAPRPSLGQALANPARLPGVVGEATVGSWKSFWGMWVTGNQDKPFLPYLTDYLEVLVAGALVVTAFGVGGLLYDRYVRDGRPLVQFAGFWGLAAVVLSPLSADISPIPWMGVHTVVPLAIPAAVALGAVYEQGRLGFAYDDRVRVGLAALVLVAAAGQVGLTAVETSYVRPQDPTPLVQFGQPDDNVKPAIEDIRAVAAANEGTDVAFYGAHFRTELFRMPFTWYLAAMGAETTVVTDATDLARDPPPVVIAPSDPSVRIDQTGKDIRPYLDGYVWRGSYAIVLEIPNNEVYADVYINETALAAARGSQPPE